MRRGRDSRAFRFQAANLTLPQYFGTGHVGNATQFAMEMTKWFDTNYHYIVPEWHADTQFSAHPERIIAQIREAQAQGYAVKPTLAK